MWLKYSNSTDNEEEEETFSRKEFPLGIVTTQEEFDFYSCCGGASLLKNSTMCTADELFFQGQILPHRGGATSTKASLAEYSSLKIRTGSMEHSDHSIGVINSNINSSITNSPLEARIRNLFHSQPSPTPQIRFSKNTHRNINSYNRKSTMWSLFRVGLVTTPEIALQDLKIRRNKHSNTSRNNSHQRKRTFLGSCKCSVETVPSNMVKDSKIIL